MGLFAHKGNWAAGAGVRPSGRGVCCRWGRYVAPQGSARQAEWVCCRRGNMLLRRVPPARRQAVSGTALHAAVLRDRIKGPLTPADSAQRCALCLRHSLRPHGPVGIRNIRRILRLTSSGPAQALFKNASGVFVHGSTLPLAASMRLVLVCVPSSARRKPEPTPPPARPHFFLWRSVA